MSKAHQLSTLKIKSLDQPGIYGDGAGLSLKVTPQGSKSWIFRFMQGGKQTWMGLGSFPEVSLAEARERAAKHREMIRAGGNPLDEKKARVATQKIEQGKGAMTFEQCVDKYYEAFSTSWTNDKYRDQWRTILMTYAGPEIGSRAVSKINADHVLRILKPIWYTKAVTAGRVRQRIETVLDWAGAMGFRTGENPARWKGLLEFLLPKRDRSANVRHHPALAFVQMAEFVQALRQTNTPATRAVEFGILTAARSGEVRFATWDEINERTGLWTIPASRMKMAKEHSVTLSQRALEILAEMKAAARSDYIFPGMRKGKPLGHSAFESTIAYMSKQRVKDGGDPWIDEKTGDAITMHGFRSSFSDWASETTDYPNEVAELSLAHVVGSQVELAYRRGSLLAKRFSLMQDWANHCHGQTKR